MTTTARRRQQRVRARALLRGSAIPVGLLLCWWAAYRYGWTDSPFLVSMQQVWETAQRLTADGTLARALQASLTRFLAGFVIGSSVGLVVGVAMGLSRNYEQVTAPTLNAIKQVSLLAWIPLISAWFGLGETSKIIFLSMAAFFPVALNTFEGVRSVPREFVEVARVFRYSRLQLVWRVVLRAALPSIFTGLYLALLYAWLATLGAEYLLAAGPGVGNLLTDGREHLWMDMVLLGMVVVGLVGFALNAIAHHLETLALRWRRGQHKS